MAAALDGDSALTKKVRAAKTAVYHPPFFTLNKKETQKEMEFPRKSRNWGLGRVGSRKGSLI